MDESRADPLRFVGCGARTGRGEGWVLEEGGPGWNPGRPFLIGVYAVGLVQMALIEQFMVRSRTSRMEGARRFQFASCCAELCA